MPATFRGIIDGDSIACEFGGARLHKRRYIFAGERNNVGYVLVNTGKPFGMRGRAA